MTQSTRTHFVDLNKYMVIVKNTPCIECPRCGEQYYTDEAKQRLDEIVENVRGMKLELAVIEYTHNAI